MKVNVGRNDKIVRIILGIIFLLLTGYTLITVSDFVFQAVVGGIFIILALIMFVTSYTGTCPIYLATGLSTAGKDN